MRSVLVCVAPRALVYRYVHRHARIEALIATIYIFDLLCNCGRVRSSSVRTSSDGIRLLLLLFIVVAAANAVAVVVIVIKQNRWFGFRVERVPISTFLCCAFLVIYTFEFPHHLHCYRHRLDST